MPATLFKDKNTPIYGDELFMGNKCPVYPMTAFFIALPTSQTYNVYEYVVRAGSSSSLLVAVDKKATKDGYVHACPIPTGMGARRLLLYIYSQRYKNPKQLVRIKHGSNNQFLRELGYSFGRTAMSKHPGTINFERLCNCTFQFRDESKNEAIGLGKKLLGLIRDPEIGDRLLVSYRQLLKAMKQSVTPEKYMTFKTHYRQLGFQEEDCCINPFFAFNAAFPVDFNQVVDTQKKSEFWNIYMFLVDYLSRVKKGKVVKLSWSMVHVIFCKRYNTIENFRYFFRQTLPDVLEIYPQAKGRIDVSNKESLILKHAPPPV